MGPGRPSYCMAGRTKRVICSDGKIVPCNYFKSSNYLCGNALTDNLLNIWVNSTILNKFRYSMEGYEECLKCSNATKCAGGCKAFSLAFYKTPFKPDPYCSIYNLSDLS